MSHPEEFVGRVEKNSEDNGYAVSQLYSELWSVLQSKQETKHNDDTQGKQRKPEPLGLPSLEILLTEPKQEKPETKPELKVDGKAETKEAEFEGYKLKVLMDKDQKIEKLTCDTKDGTLVIFVNDGVATFKTYDKNGELAMSVRGFGQIGRVEIKDGKLKHVMPEGTSEKLAEFYEANFKTYVSDPLRQLGKK